MDLKPPIFIVGCGHSGTSLVLAILGAHSKIYAVPYESKFGFKSDEAAKALFAEFDASTISHGKQRWVEKTPRHVQCVQKILAWHPTARILLIIRDGRDVACSIQDRTGSLEQGINRWVTDNLAAKAYWKHPNVYVFRYEALITDFELSLRRITKFLGEDYEEGMKSYNREPLFYYAKTLEKPPSAFGEFHGQYRNWQINQPLFDGRERWRRLSKEELSMISRIGGDLLLELGYGGK